MEIFFSAAMGKSIKYSQDQSSIMLLFEHNFRHNADIWRVFTQKHNAQIFGHNVSNPIAGASRIFVHFLAVTTRLRSVFLFLNECSPEEINSRENFPLH